MCKRNIKPDILLTFTTFNAEHFIFNMNLKKFSFKTKNHKKKTKKYINFHNIAIYVSFCMFFLNLFLKYRVFFEKIKNN